MDDAMWTALTILAVCFMVGFSAGIALAGWLYRKLMTSQARLGESFEGLLKDVVSPLKFLGGGVKSQASYKFESGGHHYRMTISAEQPEDAA